MSGLHYDAHQYQVFHPSPMQRFLMRADAWLWMLLLGFVGLVVLAIKINQPDTASLYFCMGLWVYILIRATMYNIYQLGAAGRMRIVISEEVIEFHTFGYSIIGSWHNVSRIQKLKRGKQPVECLILNRSTFVGSSVWLWMGSGLSMRNAIPLGDFSFDWRSTPLGIAIYQHVPHLFVSQTPTPPTPVSLASRILSSDLPADIVHNLFSNPSQSKWR